MYVECGAQVTMPSVTGRILIHVADRFFVQWPELVHAYRGRAEYCGSLVDETPAALARPVEVSLRKTGT
jgi:beta-1,4-N-acetylglucosaminyltransferase